MSVLCDWQIKEACKLGLVEPYIEENVQPASIDLTLSNEFIVFDKHAGLFIDTATVLDPSAKKITRAHGEGFTLFPGEFALGATVERVSIPANLMARIEGKSSLGRLGVMVHVTAGFIDPGFRGPLTLEFCNLRNVPIILHQGMSICQVSFSKMDAVPHVPYHGRYQDAEGVEASLLNTSREQYVR